MVWDGVCFLSFDSQFQFALLWLGQIILITDNYVYSVVVVFLNHRVSKLYKDVLYAWLL